MQGGSRISRGSGPSLGPSARKWLLEPPAPIAGAWTAYRQTSTDPTLPVLWRSASSGQPVLQDSARWNVRGGEYAQYFSLTSDAAWAEYIRAQEIRNAAEALLHVRRMWVARVHEERIADLSTAERAQQCGIDPAVLIGPHEPCQEIAVELVASAYRGVVTPSAALEGHLSLTLFGPRIDEQLNPFASFDPHQLDPILVQVKPFQGPCPPPAVVVDVTRPKSSTQYNRWPQEGEQRPSTPME